VDGQIRSHELLSVLKIREKSHVPTNWYSRTGQELTRKSAPYQKADYNNSPIYIYIYHIWHYLAILFVNICRDRSWHQDIRTELPQVCPVCPGIRLTVVSAHFREALPLKTTGGMSLQKFHEVATQRF
jgi:hypothetical protein